ncbi:B12-binding domain-containing radical SAM protein [Candidatus Omnitrophota bacterium]
MENGIETDIIDIKTKKNYFDSLGRRFFNYYNVLFEKLSNVDVRGKLYPDVKEQIIKETIFSSPSLIGISCITREYHSVMSIASELKNRLGAPIVVGGIHPSLYPQQFIYEKSPVDFIVIGEGEDALLELSRNLESGRGDYDSIDGIAYLKNGRFHRTSIRRLKNEILISPINVYHKLNMKFYTSVHPYVVRYVKMSGTQIFTSRGCPYRCTFCSNPLIWKMNKSYKPIRYRPIRSVIEEIKFLRDSYHIDSFYIMDDTFCIEKKRVEEFCSELKNERINLVWGSETRSNLVDEPLLKQMKKTGLVQLDIGVESGSNEMLKEIKKDITVQDTINIFLLMRKHGVRGYANFMINLPNETLEQLQETIDLMEKIRPSTGGVGITVPLPKTEIFNKYIAPRIKKDEEVINLIDKDINYIKITDDRFRLSEYNIDCEKLIYKLGYKYFRFTPSQLLKLWYWKIFLKSKKKPEYILSIVREISYFLERAIIEKLLKKIIFYKKAKKCF